jgi:hypothetical protein
MAGSPGTASEIEKGRRSIEEETEKMSAPTAENTKRESSDLVTKEQGSEAEKVEKESIPKVEDAEPTSKVGDDDEQKAPSTVSELKTETVEIVSADTPNPTEVTSNLDQTKADSTDADANPHRKQSETPEAPIPPSRNKGKDIQTTSPPSEDTPSAKISQTETKTSPQPMKDSSEAREEAIGIEIATETAPASTSTSTAAAAPSSHDTQLMPKTVLPPPRHPDGAPSPIDSTYIPPPPSKRLQNASVKEHVPSHTGGSETWEQKTYQEIVRLRMEMFWARIGVDMDTSKESATNPGH